MWLWNYFFVHGYHKQGLEGSYNSATSSHLSCVKIDGSDKLMDRGQSQTQASHRPRSVNHRQQAKPGVWVNWPLQGYSSRTLYFWEFVLLQNNWPHIKPTAYMPSFPKLRRAHFTEGANCVNKELKEWCEISPSSLEALGVEWSFRDICKCCKSLLETFYNSSWFV